WVHLGCSASHLPPTGCTLFASQPDNRVAARRTGLCKWQRYACPPASFQTIVVARVQSPVCWDLCTVRGSCRRTRWLHSPHYAPEKEVCRASPTYHLDPLDSTSPRWKSFLP